MWYDGESGNARHIGYASSSDGLNWTKHENNPVLTAGAPGAWDEARASVPVVLFDGTTYHMWYGGVKSFSHIATGYATSDMTTFVEDTESPIPTGYYLGPNYPNPFNPETRINFTIPQVSQVTLIIYDILGKKVRTLLNETKSAGSYNVIWSGKNDRGQLLASGLYIYKLQAGEFTTAKKMMYLK